MVCYRLWFFMVNLIIPILGGFKKFDRFEWMYNIQVTVKSGHSDVIQLHDFNLSEISGKFV